MSLRRWNRFAALLVLFLLVRAALAGGADPAAVYDGDFAGYVPIVGGIERPDLVVDPDDGTVPRSLAATIRRTKRRLVDGQVKPDLSRRRTTLGPRRPSAWWLRRWSTRIDLTILDQHQQPVPGARVYLASDPSFYAVNDAEDGARLFGTHRYLPYPYPMEQFLADVQRYDQIWRQHGDQPVARVALDVDQQHNTWRRPGGALATPAVEWAGNTNDAGALQVVSGVFNITNRARFPRAVAPSALRLNLIVVAEGYELGMGSWRFSRPGVRESHTIVLLRSADFELFGRPAWQRALSLVDAIPLAATTTVENLQASLATLLALLDTDLRRLPVERQTEVKRHLLARLWDRLGQRADPTLRPPLARAAWLSEPTPARALWLAEATSIAATDEETESLLRRAIETDAGFAPAYLALDTRLAARGTDFEERMQRLEPLLALRPFDRSLRGRLAALALTRGRIGEAFDHLRYTWSCEPGLGGDRELAENLFDYYWRSGLTEKAGSYLWMLTGVSPEDPTSRVRP